MNLGTARKSTHQFRLVTMRHVQLSLTVHLIISILLCLGETPLFSNQWYHATIFIQSLIILAGCPVLNVGEPNFLSVLGDVISDL